MLRTMQHLDPHDLRVVLLGDRGEETHALTEDLWRMVHASAVWIIHRAAGRARDAKRTDARAPTPTQQLVAVRKQLQKLVSAAWDARRTGTAQHWGAWRTERWVVRSGQRVTARVLEECTWYNGSEDVDHGRDRAEGETYEKLRKKHT